MLGGVGHAVRLHVRVPAEHRQHLWRVCLGLAGCPHAAEANIHAVHPSGGCYGKAVTLEREGFVSMMLFVLVLCCASGQTVLVRCLRHTETTGCVFSQSPAALRLGVQHMLCRSIGSSLLDGVAIFTFRLCFSVPLDLLGWRVRPCAVQCFATQ